MKLSIPLASIFVAASFSAVAAPVQMTEAEMSQIVAGNGATFPDNDVNPPGSGLIIEDVMSVRQNKTGGRTNDVDVINRGRACTYTRGADVNCD